MRMPSASTASKMRSESESGSFCPKSVITWGRVARHRAQ
jgi:hypothetical protein